MTIEKEIKEAVKENKLLIGSRGVIRAIKSGELSHVICSNNCRSEMREDMDYYAKNFEIEIKRFDGNSRQLGEICAKPFNIMLIGIKK